MTWLYQLCYFDLFVVVSFFFLSFLLNQCGEGGKNDQNVRDRANMSFNRQVKQLYHNPGKIIVLTGVGVFQEDKEEKNDSERFRKENPYI